MIVVAMRLKWRFSHYTDESIAHLAQKLEIASFAALTRNDISAITKSGYLSCLGRQVEIVINCPRQVGHQCIDRIENQLHRVIHINS